MHESMIHESMMDVSTMLISMIHLSMIHVSMMHVCDVNDVKRCRIIRRTDIMQASSMLQGYPTPVGPIHSSEHTTMIRIMMILIFIPI